MYFSQGRAGAAIRRARFPLAITTFAVAIGAAGAFAGDASISTVAGNGLSVYMGDGGPATAAGIKVPNDISAIPGGGFLIADTEHNRIRKVGADGTIATVAGKGSSGHDGDGGQAIDAGLNKPQGVAALNGGGFLIADTGNDRIREVRPNGTIHTVAGDEDNSGSDSDNSGPGSSSSEDDDKLKHPRGVAPLGDGFLIADTDNHVVRRVDGDGNSSIVAGTGSDGYNGDGGPATSAKLKAPYDIAPLADGGFLVSDHNSNVVRKVNPLGTITTVAGGGESEADGVLATDAVLDGPAGLVTVGDDGAFLVTEEHVNVIRRVSTAGTIDTAAGTGTTGFDGDGGPAIAAALAAPMGISVNQFGDLLIADSANHRVRSVSLGLPAPPDGTEPDAGSSIDDAPTAQFGKSVGIARASGTVRVRRPGGRWVMLTDAVGVPVGSILNTKHGKVLLRTALDTAGNSQTALLWGGVFQVKQRAKAKGLTDLILRGAKPSCKAHAKKATVSRRRRARRLWGKDDHGRYRTRGGNSVATTRGTKWLTVDRCAGTLTRVFEGSVSVRNRTSGKKVLVQAGERYLARRVR